MRRSALLLLLVPSLVLGATGIYRRGRPEDGKKKPAFAFLVNGPSAQQQGAGTLTGSRGQVITIQRASSRYCTKADGTLATLGNNTPCVEAAGLSVEPGHTNLVLQSQALDSASWTPTGVTSAAPTVTANAAVAPDGTTTAEQVAIPAVSGSAESYLKSAALTVTAQQYSTSVYAKGVSTGGTFYVYGNDGANKAGAPCTYVTGSWTRCPVVITPGATGNYSVRLGVSLPAGHAAQGAQTVCLWGVEFETGGVAHSYAPTAGTSASVVRDWPTTPSTGLPLASGSFQVTYTPRFSDDQASGPKVLFDARNAGNSDSGLTLYVYFEQMNFLGGTGAANTLLQSSSLVWTPGVTYKVRAVWGGGRVTLYRDGAQVGSGTGLSMPANYGANLNIGTDYNGGGAADGNLSDFRFYR